MKTSFKIMTFLFVLLMAAVTVASFVTDPAAGVGITMALAAVAAVHVKSSADLRQEKAEIYQKVEAIINGAKSEKRSMTAEEKTTIDGFLAEMRELDSEIDRMTAIERRALEVAGNYGNFISEKEEREIASYSFQKVIRAGDRSRLTGLEKEMHDEAEREMKSANTSKSIEGIGVPSIVFRAASATAQNSVAGDKGGMTIATEKMGLLESLYPFLILRTLGANFLGGLQGNIDFPRGSAASATWKTEVAASAEYDPTFALIQMSPKRLPALAKYTNQLLVQSSADIETWIKNQLLKSIAVAVEQAAIAGASGGANPVGILSTSGIGSVVGGAAGLAPAWSHIVDLEKKIAVENADMGALAYLTNPKVRSKFKTTLKASGVAGYIWEEGLAPLNGYKCGITNLVPSNLTKVDGQTTVTDLSAIIFGNFNDLLIGQWGGMDLVVDPYTAKATGTIEVQANTFWDVAVLQPKSFAAMVDAIAGT